jgi:phenylacetic acid degradation operon negative regulatory protein
MAQRALDLIAAWPGMNPVRARSMLFTLYGDYAYPRGRDVRLGGLVEIGLALGISEVATRSAVARLAREGWLTAKREGIRSRYGLTASGRRLIDEGTRRIYAGRASGWNGKWCILTYSIPEEQRALRDRIRKRLAWLGFGAMGPGAYVNPRDAAEGARALLIEHGVAGFARVFSATLDGPGDDADLVAACWDVRAIGEKHAAFYDHYKPLHRRDVERRRRRTLSDVDCFATRFALTHDFRRFPFIDPGLPDRLVPAGWPGKRAERLFQEHHALLRDGALRYFDRIAGGDG